MLQSILSPLSGYISQIKMVLGVAALVAVMALYGAYRSSQEEIRELLQQVGTQEAALATQKATIEHLTNNIQAQKAMIQESQESASAIKAENQELKSILTKARSKEHVAKAKPGLMSKRINSASHRLFQEIGCATGRNSPECNNPSPD